MKINNKNGITLISLIITIIIMLVLLGLTDVILPDNLFDKADKADNKTNTALKETQNKINSIKESLPDIEDTICSAMTICTLNKTTTTTPCTECNSTGVIGCPGGTIGITWDDGYGLDYGRCDVCKQHSQTGEKWYKGTVYCSACSETWDFYVCWDCKDNNSAIIAASGFSTHSVTIPCEICKGLGSITTESYDSECSRCGLSGIHYYCSIHNVSSYSNSHIYTN